MTTLSDIQFTLDIISKNKKRLEASLRETERFEADNPSDVGTSIRDTANQAVPKKVKAPAKNVKVKAPRAKSPTAPSKPKEKKETKKKTKKKILPKKEAPKGSKVVAAYDKLMAGTGKGSVQTSVINRKQNKRTAGKIGVSRSDPYGAEARGAGKKKKTKKVKVKTPAKAKRGLKKSLESIQGFLQAAIILKRGEGADQVTRLTGVNTNTAMRQKKPKEGKIRGTVREVPIPKKGKHSNLISSIRDASTISGKNASLNKNFNGLLDAYQDRWISKLDFNADGSSKKNPDGTVARNSGKVRARPTTDATSFPVTTQAESEAADSAKLSRASANRERVTNEKRD